MVPLFGLVANACFGRATIAAAGTSRQQDVGTIYAIFPFSSTNPQGGRYQLRFRKRDYTDELATTTATTGAARST